MMKCQGKEDCKDKPTFNLQVVWSYDYTKKVQYEIDVCSECYTKHIHLEIHRPECMGVFVISKELV